MATDFILIGETPVPIDQEAEKHVDEVSLREQEKLSDAFLDALMERRRRQMEEAALLARRGDGRPLAVV